MTLLELLVALDGFGLSTDGEAILVTPPYHMDPDGSEWAAVRASVRENWQALLAMLPKVPPDAPPKVRGPGGNVVDCKH
jgi:hypothetical protein